MTSSHLEHQITFRVYYSDTDAGGVVYYATYGQFFERGRTELLHAAGLSAKELMAQYRLLLPVVTLKIDYHRPAYYDDTLRLITTLSELTAVRLSYQYKLVRANNLDPNQSHSSGIKEIETLIATGHTVNAAVDAETMRPRRLPKEFKECFS